ncbi:MAG: ATP-binding protein, partial [Gemmatimonadetes bacterium]|nr:ATP-binding protein [Gemmatimonadota bacterium]
MERSLRVFPVTVLMGPRQTGKTTLARHLSAGTDRLYLTLDDLEVREQARTDPAGLLARAPRLVLDEVQRAPDLLLEIKRAVDAGPDRQPGRFILTGSANLLLMDRVSESLAGRAGYVTLWPMTRGELEGRASAGAWNTLLDEPPGRWMEVLPEPRAHADWRALAKRGGYPVPAHQLVSEVDRTTWFAGYVRTYLERDVQQLAAIEQLGDFRLLMTLVSLRLGGVLNQAELARDAALSHATAHRYLNLMETSFQTFRLQPFAGSRTKRHVKSPKLYWTDTALALHIAREAEPTGAHLENLVLADLLSWQESRAERPEILYWRTYDGTEVDVVLAVGGRLLAVEIKATTKPRFGDADGLRAFRDVAGPRFHGGVLL